MDSKDCLRVGMEWGHFNTHKFKRAPRDGEGTFDRDGFKGASQQHHRTGVRVKNPFISANLRALDTTSPKSTS